MKVIFEDQFIEVVDNEHDYDFIGYIKNKSNFNIKITFDDVDYEDYPIEIKANDWIGFLADSAGYNQFELITNGKYTIEEEN